MSKNKSSLVKSETIYSPQAFVEAVTGYCYCFKQEDTIKEIEQMLERHCSQPLWNYPITEIEHIVENGLSVVLVDVTGMYGGSEMVQMYRWFEVPEDFEEEDV